MKITKFFFYILNLLFVVFYLYPGSILGFFLYNDFSKQPQVTSDFIFSSNHVYAFAILSLLGLISHINKKKLIIFYFIFLSIILELSHLVIPNRSFQFSDLFGNILGVLISILILKIYFYLEKK
jgi:VanZ family protein|tara:strand:+ start:4105 stop:4476 length:372 start_codon:yes stop_codon:yes gene_type:complete